MATEELSAGDKEYIFERDDRSSIRLNFHHWVIKNLCGYLLHPCISIDSPNLRVADVGAGTGIWALEASKELPPSTTIEAFDISSAQFPPQNLVPSQIDFQIHDAFTSFPKEKIGTFDVVHIRFFSTLMDSNKIIPMIKNLMSLLKPDGYLQWFEPDMLTAKAMAPSPQVSASATEQMVKLMRKPTPDSEFGWVPQLGTIFKQCGLETSVYHRVPLDDRSRLFLSQVHLMTYEEYCDKLEDNGKVEEALSGRKAIKSLKGEMHEGVSAVHDHVCVVGKKPSAPETNNFDEKE